MKYAGYITAILLSAPMMTHAYTVTSSSYSSASSGGVSAGAGEHTVTDSSYSSVQITNTIKSGDNGGTSKTVIETTQNGTTTREEKTTDIAPHEGVEVTASASARSGAPAEVSVEVSTSSADVIATTSVDVKESAVQGVITILADFFKTIFSIFR